MVLGEGPRHSWRRVQWAFWLVGTSVLAVLVASSVGPAPRRSWRRVPLVLLMVRVVGVLVFQVLYRVVPRVRALWVVMLQPGCGVAGDADGEDAVGDAPGDAMLRV